MIDDDGFKIVTRKQHGKSRSKALVKKHLPINRDGVVECDVKDIDKCRQQIKDCLRTLEASSFWKDFQLSLQHACSCGHVVECPEALSNEQVSFKEMIVYGIGAIAHSRIARYQLALVLLLMRNYAMHTSLFDPVLTSAEKSLLEDFDVHIISSNEECKRKATNSTMFVMIHCGKTMYNNLLWANWHCLSNICIIGNAFSSYLERVPSRILQTSATFLTKIIPFTREDRVLNSFQHDDVFNDTAIHTFPSALLRTARSELWEHAPEPSRDDDDTEMIFAGK